MKLQTLLIIGAISSVTAAAASSLVPPILVASLFSVAAISMRNTNALPLTNNIADPLNWSKPNVKIREKRMLGFTSEKYLNFATFINKIERDENETEHHVMACSGIILDDSTILTASHCVGLDGMSVGVGSSFEQNVNIIPVLKVIERYNDNYDYSDFVFLGEESSLTELREITNITPPQKITVTPECDECDDDDMVLLKVKRHALKGYGLSFAPLSKPHIIKTMKEQCKNNKPEDIKVWVIGAGIKNDDDNSTYSTMRFGSVNVKKEECIIGNRLHVEYNYEAGKSMWCPGDSGGGVFREQRRTGLSLLIGIVKDGDHCNEKSGVATNGTATLINRQSLKFIKKHMEKTKGLPRWSGCKNG